MIKEAAKAYLFEHYWPKKGDFISSCLRFHTQLAWSTPWLRKQRVQFILTEVLKRPEKYAADIATAHISKKAVIRRLGAIGALIAKFDY